MPRAYSRRALHVVSFLFFLSLLAPMMPAALADTGTPEPATEVQAAPTDPSPPEPTVVPTDPPPPPEPTAIPTEPPTPAPTLVPTEPLPPAPTVGPPPPTATSEPVIPPTAPAPEPTDAPTPVPTTAPTLEPTEGSTATSTDTDTGTEIGAASLSRAPAMSTQEIDTSSESSLLTLTVVVRDATNSAPIPGASVQILDTTSNEIASGVTDVAGEYPARLIDGAYSVQVSGNGYRSAGSSVSLSTDQTLDINLTPAEAGRITVSVQESGTGTFLENTNISIRSWATGQILENGVSDILGSFESASLDPGEYTVMVTLFGYESVTRYVAVDGNESLSFSLVPLPSGAASLIVVDALTGAPIAGAQVTVTAQPIEGASFIAVDTVTDAAGMVVIPDIDTHDYNIVVSHPDYEGIDFWAYLQVGAPLSVELQPANLPGTITFTVLNDADSAPIDGATIRVYDDAGSTEFVTDSTGNVTTQAFPAGEYYVEASAEGFRDQPASVSVSGDSASTIRLAPREPGTISLVVWDSGFLPIANATVDIARYDAGSGTFIPESSLSGTTNSEGEFVSPQAAHGRYLLSVSAAGYFSQEIDTSVDGDWSRLITLESNIPGEITITLTDALNSGPIDGATVVVTRWDDTASDYVPVETMTEILAGTYVSGLLDQGLYEIQASRSGYFDLSTGLEVAGPISVDYVMQPLTDGHLTVTVTSEGDEPAPITGATVRIWYLDATDNQVDVAEGITDAAGAWRSAEPLTARDYRAEITHPDYHSWSVSFRLSGDSDLHAFLTPRVFGTLTLFVTDDQDTPIDDAAVEIFDSWSELVGSGPTANGGAFEAGTLEEGWYRLQITKDGYLPLGNIFVEVTGDTTTTLRLVTLEDTPLTVTVRDSQTDTPIANISVEIRTWDDETGQGDIVAEGLTDTSGEFVSPTLVAGQYYVQASATGYGTASTSLWVSGDQDDVTLWLYAELPGTLTVSVQNDALEPVDGASVVAFANGGGDPFQLAPTDVPGEYTTPDRLPFGEYAVEVSASGFFTETTWVWINGDTVTPVSLQARLGGTLTIDVVSMDDASVTIPDATIVITDRDTLIQVATLTTDGNGIASINLDAADYTIETSAVGYAFQSTEVRVAGDTSLQVALDPVVPGILTVTVTAQDTEAAIEGAQVSMWRVADWTLVASGPTGADGTFSTSILPGGEYYIDASATGYFSGAAWTLVKGDTQAEVILELRISGHLTVIVEDLEGNPIEGASLEVSGDATWFTGLTGANGVFTTTTPLESGTYAITPSADGFFTGSTDYVLVNGDVSITFTLEPKVPGVLTFTVRDSATSDLIEGVDIWLWSVDLQQEFTLATGSDGTATSDELPGGTYQIRFSHPDYFFFTRDYRLSGNATIEQSLEPRIPGTWTLTVLDESTHDPIPNAEVVISSESLQDELTTDANGQLVVALPGDAFWSVIRADGYFERAMSFQVAGDREDTISLTPRVSGVLTFEVTDAISGNAIEGARVTLAGDDIADGDYGFTFNDGFFTSATLQGGYYMLSITADGYFPAYEAVLIEGDVARAFALQPRTPGTVTVTVTDALTQQPIEGVTVELRGMSLNAPVDTGVTNDQGEFTSIEVAGETYYALVAVPGYITTLSNEIFVNGPVSTDVAMTPISAMPDVSLAVEVTGVNGGDPIVGAHVTLMTYVDGVTISGFTGVDGIFRPFNPTPATNYEITISADGFITHRGHLDLYEDTTYQAALTPTTTVPLAITLISVADESPVAGASITMRPLDPFTGDSLGDPIMGTTDANGNYTLPDAPWGIAYHGTAVAAGYLTQDFYIPLTDEAGPQPVTQTVTLYPLPGEEYVARALDRYTRDPIAGAAVSIWFGEALGDPDLIGVTGQDGAFDTGMPLDAWRITVRMEATGYFTTTLPGHYGDILMEPVYQPRAIGITLVDSETHAPIPGADIRLYACLDTSCDPIVGTGVTDANGQIGFSGLQPGVYQAEAYADGYPPLRRAFRGSETRIFVIHGDAAVTFEITPLAILQQTDVTVALDQGVDGTWTLVNPGDGSFTRNGTIIDGVGDIGLIPHGSGYVLTVNADGFEPVTRTFRTTMTTMRLEVPLGDVAAPTPTPTTEAPTPTATTEAPTPTATTEAPTPTATTEAPTPTATSAVPTATTAVPTATSAAPTATTAAPTATSAAPTATSAAPTATSAAPTATSAAPTATTAAPTATSAAPTATSAAPTATSEPPTPTSEPTAEPTATAEPSPTGPAEEPLETNFTLCSNPECEPPHNTGADGYTASWNVSETDSGAQAHTLLASIDVAGDAPAPMAGQGSNSRSPLPTTMQESPRTWVITATIVNGVATGFSEPLPEGRYNVCLDPLLRGPDGSTIRIMDAPACDVVTHDPVPDPDDPTGPGEPTGPEGPTVSTFSVVLLGAPEVIPPDGGEPGRPAPNPPGNPTVPPQVPGDPGAPPSEGEPPKAPAKPITSRPDERAQVTGLPSTGASERPGSAQAALVAATAVILAGVALGVRSRWRT